MNRAKILFVDDNPDVVVFAVDQLEYFGYEVQIARNGAQALRRVEEDRPDLIVLDIMMPEVDGYEVCRRLKSSADTRSIPILMLSAKGQTQDKVMGLDVGADDYLPKPYDQDEFKARIEALLRRCVSPPYEIGGATYTVSLLCRPGYPTNIRINGASALTDVTCNNLVLNVDEFGRLADETLMGLWRFRSKDVGKRLFQQVFIDHPAIFSGYEQIHGSAIDDSDLGIKIEGTSDLLRVPFEFLYNPLPADGDYLVLRHPLSRIVNGMHTRHVPVSPMMLNELCRTNTQLRILLIASNTGPDNSTVDQETVILANLLQVSFAKKRIPIYVKIIPSEQATYDHVRAELRKCQYHILHYAGHAAHHQGSPEQSALLFWEQSDKRGRILPMTVSDVQGLLRGSDLRFVYLSCCQGTQTGNKATLLDSDFLGIAEGIVHAGVPSVLGFRWAVEDSSARDLAVAFYESLASHGRLDVALLHARCEFAGPRRDDITWLSPVLILQA